MQKSFKEIISEIKAIANNQQYDDFVALKYGGTPPPKGKGEAGAKSAPSKSPAKLSPPKPGTSSPSGTTTGGYVARSNDISEMQKALRDFAVKAVDYKKITTKDDKTKKIKQTIRTDDKRRDFNDFLAEQFMSSADIHGEEWTKDQKATDKASKLPTDIIQLNHVIDGLSRIGPGKSEEKVDGIWDFRTNNAVRNTYAFANALVTAYEALGNTAPNVKAGFTRADLAQLGQSIPPQKDPAAAKVPQATLNEYAKKITPLVIKLTEFYESYSKDIMNHPDYKRYINQDTALYTFTPGGTDPYKPDPKNPDQKKFMENPATFILPTLTLTSKDGNAVKLDNKISLQSFQTLKGITGLMTQYLGYTNTDINNTKMLIQVVRSILAEVNKFIDANKKSMPQSLIPAAPERYQYKL